MRCQMFFSTQIHTVFYENLNHPSIFDHLVLNISREPVGLAWMQSNDHGCPPSILLHPRLRPSQIHLRRPLHSVDVVAVYLARFPIAIDMTLVLYACCIV